jgi:hypothetical protein
MLAGGAESWWRGRHGRECGRRGGATVCGHGAAMRWVFSFFRTVGGESRYEMVISCVTAHHRERPGGHPIPNITDKLFALRRQIVQYHVKRHYWTRVLCRGPQTLGKGFVEGGPRQRALGKFWVGEEVFTEGYLSGTRQSLCRGPKKPSAKKNPRQNVNKKTWKNSKIILFFFETPTSHHPHLLDFFVAFYTVFFTLFVKS